MTRTPVERKTRVAQKTQILYVDDIDGTEAEGTLRFGYSGVEYEIDLNRQHADEFANAIGPYLEAARKVSAAGQAAELRVRSGITSLMSVSGRVRRG
jgi:hypothetical protein